MCIFCDFAKEKNLPGHGPFFFRLDVHPVNPGHLLVIPRRHAASFLDLEFEELRKLGPAILEGLQYIDSLNLFSSYEQMIKDKVTPNSSVFAHRALGTLKGGDRPLGYNVGFNDGVAAGQTVGHFHVHVIPRYKGDVANPTGGIRWVIPDKGNYKIL